MTLPDVSGDWIGHISGTNFGGIAITLNQEGSKVQGVASISDPVNGQYQYDIAGSIDRNLTFSLTPKPLTRLRLGQVHVVCTSITSTTMAGTWNSTVGTAGAFSANRSTPVPQPAPSTTSTSVFIVHGHDEGAKQSVARLLERLGITPIILQEQPNQGRTILEKFEDSANKAAFAVVIMTPDDIGYSVAKESLRRPRARQNVVLELGYFAAKIGRARTFVLTKGDIEVPSDVLGLVYESMDKGDGWHLRLAKELRAAGFTVDLNKI